MSLCLQVVSQAPQHLRSSEMQTTCDGCFAIDLKSKKKKKNPMDSPRLEKCGSSSVQSSEPVWPSGKALGW